MTERVIRAWFLWQYANAYAAIAPVGFVWCDCRDCSSARRSLEVASSLVSDRDQ